MEQDNNDITLVYQRVALIRQAIPKGKRFDSIRKALDELQSMNLKLIHENSMLTTNLERQRKLVGRGVEAKVVCLDHLAMRYARTGYKVMTVGNYPIVILPELRIGEHVSEGDLAVWEALKGYINQALERNKR